MSYVDGFVVAVPTANKDAYRAIAEQAALVFKDHGALHQFECWGDDVPKGEHTDFYGAVQAKDDETIVFSFIIWPDKATRDAAQEKAMSDPRMPMDMTAMPFDGKRMIYGGFVPIMEIHHDA